MKILFKMIFLLFLIMFFLNPIKVFGINVDSLSLDLGLQKDSSGNDNVFLSIYSCLSGGDISLEYESNVNKYKSENESKIVFDQHIQSNINLDNYFIFIDSGYIRNTLINIDEVDFGTGYGIVHNGFMAQTGLYRSSGIDGDKTLSKTKINYSRDISEFLRFIQLLEFGQNIEKSDDSLTTSVSSLVLLFEKFFTFKLSYKFMYDNMPSNDEKKFSSFYATSGIKF